METKPTNSKFTFVSGPVIINNLVYNDNILCNFGKSNDKTTMERKQKKT